MSTPRQGERGVSLPEQREAIERYAHFKNLSICRWFEGRETASKVGRPVFNQMLALLKKGQAKGVIIHKIDRSARNLTDWAEIRQLMEGGIEVHFAVESLDLTSSSGLLSADLQAAVSIYYSRNLREEVKKGFYGRLKQGYYPMPAPLGYLDVGPAQPKIPDPERAPLIRKAFELYATGGYSQVSLAAELHRRGLMNKAGHKLTKNFLGRILRNPFYVGLIRIQKTNQTYLGAHTPLISKALFDRVQAVLEGHVTPTRVRHDFQFRHLFRCKLCGKLLIPEQQKGHVYYRCQTRSCPTKCIREEPVEQEIKDKLKLIQLNDEQHGYLQNRVEELKEQFAGNRTTEVAAIEIKLSQIKGRIIRLTDAFLDNMIDRDTFEDRKMTLLMEQRGLEDAVREALNGSPAVMAQLNQFLELIKSAYSQYIVGLPAERRELIKTVFSNRTLHDKRLEITLAVPFAQVAECQQNTSGEPSRTTARTWNQLAHFIFNFFKKGVTNANGALDGNPGVLG